MAILLPWFPDGDTTAPVNESVYHRFFGDYHQTYDLAVWDYPIPNVLSTIAINNSEVIKPLGNPTLIERFVPLIYSQQRDYFLTYCEWLKQFFGLREFDSVDILTKTYSVSFPLALPVETIKIYYLTRDTNEGEYIRRSQLVLDGVWDPLEPVLINSVSIQDGNGFNVIPDWSEDELDCLLSNNWCLPNPSDLQDLWDDDPRIVNKRTTTTIKTSTESYRVIPAPICRYVNNEPDEPFNGNFVDLIVYPVYVDESLGETETSQAQQRVLATIESINCSDSFILPQVEVSSIIDGIAEFLRIPISEATAYFSDLEADGYVLHYIVDSFLDDNCQAIEPIPEGTGSTEIETVDIEYLNGYGLYFYWFKSADNNYWGLQTDLDYTDGFEPCTYYQGEETYLNLVLLACGGFQSYAVVDLRSTETNSFEQTPASLTYRTCSGLINEQSITFNYFSETTETNTVVIELVREVDFGNPDNILVRSDNTKILTDAYFLENNNAEFDIDMPDSVRMKEIHAALEADIWGNGQTKQFKVFGQGFLSLFIDKASFQAVVQPALQPESQGLEEQPVTTLPQLIRRMLRMLAGFTGIHDFPTLRQPTYVLPERDAETGQITREEDPAPIVSLYEYLVTLDKEVQTKLGLWPAVSYNYAQDEEGVGESPKRELLGSVAALGSDLFELSTRSSLVTEGARIATLITQDQTFEIIKGMGLMFSVEEVELFEGNFISVPRFNGGASLSAQNLAIAQAIDRSSCTTVLPGSLLDTIGVPQDSPIRTPSGGASRRV